jgi:hypothetical protein
MSNNYLIPTKYTFINKQQLAKKYSTDIPHQCFQTQLAVGDLLAWVSYAE